MKLSVIIAACERELHGGANRLPMLEKCLHSVLDGGHEDFECLVCSDGHSEAIEVLTKGQRDPRISYHFVERRGVYGAGTQRNAMMDIATGDLLIWIDDDDRYTPGALAKVAKLAEKHPGHPLVWCMQYPRTGRILWTDDKKSTKDRGLLRKGHIGTPMIGIPNIKEKLGRWGMSSYSDGIFVESTMEHDWPEVIWSKEVLALVRSQGDRQTW